MKLRECEYMGDVCRCTLGNGSPATCCLCTGVCDIHFVYQS
jgi:hypothetical protein